MKGGGVAIQGRRRAFERAGPERFGDALVTGAGYFRGVSPAPPDPLRTWKDPRHRRGLAGERAAISYLLRNGWSIEAHRFRLGHHDLDLVARKGR